MSSKLFVVSGDAPFLLNEYTRALRKKLYRQGFEQYDCIDIQAHFDWAALQFELKNIGLFDPKRIVNIRNLDNRCDSKSTKAMLAIAADIPEELAIIMTFGKLTSAQLKSSWYKKLSQISSVEVLKAPLLGQLPQWIQKRSTHYQLKIQPQAAKLLAELTEGNLLATDQALQKCQLLNLDSIAPEHIQQVISDSAEYNVFDLSDSLLKGDTKQSLHITRHLLQQSSEATLVAWSITKLIRELYNIQFAINYGDGAESAMRHIWSSKKALYQQALKRLNLQQLSLLLQGCQKLDLSIKGIKKQPLLTSFERIIIELCRPKA